MRQLKRSGRRSADGLARKRRWKLGISRRLTFPRNQLTPIFFPELKPGPSQERNFAQEAQRSDCHQAEHQSTRFGNRGRQEAVPGAVGVVPGTHNVAGIVDAHCKCADSARKIDGGEYTPAIDEPVVCSRYINIKTHDVARVIDTLDECDERAPGKSIVVN